MNVVFTNVWLCPKNVNTYWYTNQEVSMTKVPTVLNEYCVPHLML